MIIQYAHWILHWILQGLLPANSICASAMGAAGAKESESTQRRAQLLQRAQDLCEAFAQRKSLEEAMGDPGNMG